MNKRTPLATPSWAKKDDPRVEPVIAPPDPLPPPVDGRSLRATGRTEQLATRIKPETKARIQQIARDEGISMAEAIERAIESYHAGR